MNPPLLWLSHMKLLIFGPFGVQKMAVSCGSTEYFQTYEVSIKKIYFMAAVYFLVPEALRSYFLHYIEIYSKSLQGFHLHPKLIVF